MASPLKSNGDAIRRFSGRVLPSSRLDARRPSATAELPFNPLLADRRRPDANAHCVGSDSDAPSEHTTQKQGETVEVAIVYDSSTGKTKAAAEQMGEAARVAGHECSVESIHGADPAQVTRADAVCVGSWCKGLFVILQRPTEETMDIIERLGPLDGKPAAVFTTYALAVGKTLPKMAVALGARGASVTGELKSKGPRVAEGFDSWLRTLET